MESVRKAMQEKKVCSAVRPVCIMVTMIGISLSLYGCGRGASVEDTVSEEIAVQVSEEPETDRDYDSEESSVKNKFFTRQICAYVQIRRLWQEWGINIEETEFSGQDNTELLEIPLLEQLFTYEKAENSIGQYLVITGISEKYKDQFIKYLVITGISEKYQNQYMIHMLEHPEWIDTQRKCLKFPTDVNGIPVKEIGAFAFADLEIDGVELLDSIEVIGAGAFRNTEIKILDLPENLKSIGEAAFENCRLERIEFPKQLSFIGKRAFAGNTALWTVLIHKVDLKIGEAAFADCSEDFLLCYGDDTDGMENLAAKYAGENGLDTMEIILSQTPIIHYPTQPYVLYPRIDNFFYGDYEDLEEEQWCTWEQDENAPNFGYSDWQWGGCSTWCGVMDFEQMVEASSELASTNGRYSAEHVLVQNRDAAWVEGVDGYGIGESITYRQSCTNLDHNKWVTLRQDCRTPEYDGFMRYTEICIVNGYAKNQKTWEENGRIKRLVMYVEDKPYAYLELEDTILPQYFTLPEGDIQVLSGGMIEVRFEIAEIYPGSVYEDTCLTGLVMEFSGRHAH